MNVLIAGGSGLVGKALTQALINQGYEVSWVSRSPAMPSLTVTCYSYEDLDHLKASFHAVVNLAGEPISQFWSKKAKQNIYNSRIHTTGFITQLIEKGQLETKVYISGSAIGYYGDGQQNRLTEAAPAGSGFLAKTASAWEEKSLNNQTRTLQLRTGIVLSNKGGILPLWTKPALWGLGTVWGSGHQYVPWIHIEDLTNLIIYLIQRPDLSGPINACSPEPATAGQIQKTLAHILHRPQLITVPQFLCHWLLGDMVELLLYSQCAVPEKLLQVGFHFRYASLEPALKTLLMHDKSLAR